MPKLLMKFRWVTHDVGQICEFRQIICCILKTVRERRMAHSFYEKKTNIGSRTRFNKWRHCRSCRWPWVLDWPYQPTEQSAALIGKGVVRLLRSCATRHVTLATLSRDKVARRNRAIKLRVWHRSNFENVYTIVIIIMYACRVAGNTGPYGMWASRSGES